MRMKNWCFSLVESQSQKICNIFLVFVLRELKIYLVRRKRIFSVWTLLLLRWEHRNGMPVAFFSRCVFFISTFFCYDNQPPHSCWALHDVTWQIASQNATTLMLSHFDLFCQLQPPPAQQRISSAYIRNKFSIAIGAFRCGSARVHIDTQSFHDGSTHIECDKMQRVRGDSDSTLGSSIFPYGRSVVVVVVAAYTTNFYCAHIKPFQFNDSWLSFSSHTKYVCYGKRMPKLLCCMLATLRLYGCIYALPSQLPFVLEIKFTFHSCVAPCCYFYCCWIPIAGWQA